MADAPHPHTQRDYRQVDHIEDLIDEAGAESFPASDPPAVTPRRRPVSPPPAARGGDAKGPR